MPSEIIVKLKRMANLPHRKEAIANGTHVPNVIGNRNNVEMTDDSASNYSESLDLARKKTMGNV